MTPTATADPDSRSSQTGESIGGSDNDSQSILVATVADTSSVSGLPAPPPSSAPRRRRRPPIAPFLMSSQRSRAPRGGQRAAGQDTETLALWNQIQEDLRKIARLETKAKEVTMQSLDREAEMKAKGSKASIEDINALDTLYRQNVRISEEIKNLYEDQEGLNARLGILYALVKGNEDDANMAMGRTSSSRQSATALELDGGADTPTASPAPRKMQNNGRISSQPPSNTFPVVEIPDKEDRSETGSNTSKTKIIFAVNDEVAFKPKQVPGQEASDWIQGIVTKVIGEGKSRRYDVKDPYPAEGEVSQNYRSSASSMVPVPPAGVPLPDYEVGKEVLGLYPGSSCFYKAEVKAMKGDKVELLFEDDEADTQRLVDRRFVLDFRVTKDGKK
ncbi:saga complex subunit sgf29 [Phlyctema vagabunda]|uniref:Saga complex subunit sgf29 n=1 Tax=Phlyctema vagabunda TaxID=108571 RepID=A0ABR4PHL1_9HELO